MKKIRLAVDDLQINSFRTTTGVAATNPGTVKGKDYTQDCPGYGCTQGNSTCEYPTNHCCAETYTFAQPQCYQLQPRTYYCFCDTDFYQCGAQSAPNPC
jgi:hypothetical protein